ncbi:MAG: hypothetical protein K2H93_05065, partial [Oscillospiraceae bacterium]|nr:hypothetical protein [Oscillospiraceae bacterium]
MKKKILISILTMLIILLSAPVTMHANAILGDVNGDSVLDVNDAYAILEHSASIGAGNGGTLSDKALISADYNADGKVNAKDAFKILVYSGQLITNGLQLDTIEEWKQAYSIQITKYQSYKNRYELADINGDSIPELFIKFYENTYKTIVYTYQDGSCQQIYFPTESGAIDSCNLYACSEFDGLFVQNSLTSITNYFCDVVTIYKIDNFTAIPQHTLTIDYAHDSYYFDDTPITREEYNNYQESVYWHSYFSDTKKRDLLNIYGSEKVQANFIKDSINFNQGLLEFKVTCNQITEKSNITFHVVPHDSE